MLLLRGKTSIDTLFNLRGINEDDMTHALGYVVSRSPRFAAALVAAVGGGRLDPEKGSVHLQDADGDGRTDVELKWPGQFHAVLEAKRGPWLPTVTQLRKYVPRLKRSGAASQHLVTVTNAPPAYATAALPLVIVGIPVCHLTWRRILQLTRAAASGSRTRDRALLYEFALYLEEILGMENVRSNMVYVLSLGAGGAWGLDFKDVVINRSCYFDPVSRYKSELPNYLAFRYDGRLQTIHHVEGVLCFNNPRSVFKDAESCEDVPHYLFRLGPAITPTHLVKTGPGIPQARRAWCMLDLLLTSTTIREAEVTTQRRLKGAEREGADSC